MRRHDFTPVSLDDWRQRVRSELDGAEPETLVRHSLDGLELEPFYTEQSLEGVVASTPPPTGSPRLCPRIDGAGPRAVAAQIEEHLAGGADGVWIDRPEESGLETAEDLAVALASDRLDGADLWLGAGAEAGRRLATWGAWLEAREPSTEGMTLHLGLDPLGALARRGMVPRPLPELVEEAVCGTREIEPGRAGSTALTVSTAAYQEAGADLATELAFAVATLSEYVSAGRAVGIEAAELLPRIALRFAVGCQIFSEIAKLRAVRVLWRGLAGALGLERMPPLRLHVVGSRRTYSRREPRINLLRATQQSMIAACGGATAVSLPAHDALGDSPGELGRRLARTIPMVLEHEGRLGRVADPAAGAYMVEAATKSLADAGWSLAREIEGRGGMARELLSGDAAERVEAAWRSRRTAYEEESAGLTGVTDYVDEAAEILLAADETREAPSGGGEEIEPFTLRRDAEPYEAGGSDGGGKA